MKRTTTEESAEIIAEVQRLSETTASRDVALLAKAIVAIAKQALNNRQNNRSAFEQIEELGRRQLPDKPRAKPRTARPK